MFNVSVKFPIVITVYILLHPGLFWAGDLAFFKYLQLQIPGSWVQIVRFYTVYIFTVGAVNFILRFISTLFHQY